MSHISRAEGIEKEEKLNISRVLSTTEQSSTRFLSFHSKLAFYIDKLLLSLAHGSTHCMKDYQHFPTLCTHQFTAFFSYKAQTSKYQKENRGYFSRNLSVLSHFISFRKRRKTRSQNYS